MEEVDALRSLAVELHKAKLTVDEAKEGTKIEKAFIKLGISPATHMILVKVCKEINDQEFVNAALKLAKIGDYILDNSSKLGGRIGVWKKAYRDSSQQSRGG